MTGAGQGTRSPTYQLLPPGLPAYERAHGPPLTEVWPLFSNSPGSRSTLASAATRRLGQ